MERAKVKVYFGLQTVHRMFLQGESRCFCRSPWQKAERGRKAQKSLPGQARQGELILNIKNAGYLLLGYPAETIQYIGLPSNPQERSGVISDTFFHHRILSSYQIFYPGKVHDPMIGSLRISHFCNSGNPRCIASRSIF